MKKTLAIISVIVCILVVLAGCSTKRGEPPRGEPEKLLTIEQNIKVIEEKGISEIGIYKSEAHGTVGKTLVKKLTSSEEQSTVLQALKTAKQIPGDLNTATPDYDFVIQLKNNESFALHFWLLKATGEMTGMFVNVKDTGTGYSLSKESTQALLKFVK